jgi:hypothetical protein
MTALIYMWLFGAFKFFGAVKAWLGCLGLNPAGSPRNSLPRDVNLKVPIGVSKRRQVDGSSNGPW